MFIRIVAAALVAATSLPALAGPAADTLGACLADHTSGKERKDLAKWIFVAMSAHPEMNGLSRVDAGVRDGSDRALAAIFTRLLTQDCVDPARQALAAEGAAAYRVAFGKLGELAMQEIMSNPGVSASMGGFEKYVPQDKVAAALAPR